MSFKVEDLDSEVSSSLIVGLGNPGSSYEKTRHNIGFEVVRALASKYGLSFKKDALLKAEIAKGRVENHKVTLVLPQTYMNRSGEAVVRALKNLKLSKPGSNNGVNVGEGLTERKPEIVRDIAVDKTDSSYSGLLVVADDIYIPFGSLKIRSHGGFGGHNGLKNIGLHLNSQNYPRLRMGVGPQDQDYSQRIDLGEALEDYVLSRFSTSESVHLADFIDNGVKVIDSWLKEGLTAAHHIASQLKTRVL